MPAQAPASQEEFCRGGKNKCTESSQASLLAIFTQYSMCGHPQVRGVATNLTTASCTACTAAPVPCGSDVRKPGNPPGVTLSPATLLLLQYRGGTGQMRSC